MIATAVDIDLVGVPTTAKIHAFYTTEDPLHLLRTGQNVGAALVSSLDSCGQKVKKSVGLKGSEIDVSSKIKCYCVTII